MICWTMATQNVYAGKLLFRESSTIDQGTSSPAMSGVTVVSPPKEYVAGTFHDFFSKVMVLVGSGSP